MRYFTKEKIVTTVQRLSYSGGKGTYSTVATALNGYLRPLDESASAINGMQWGNGFNLITELGVNIQVGDLVTIASVVYTVRGMAIHDRGGYTSYNKYLMTRGQVQPV